VGQDQPLQGKFLLIRILLLQRLLQAA
jgi:hypothetical protein